MKKLLIALVLASASTTASANFDFFGGGNEGEWVMGPNGPYWEEGSSWPQWTPMYWMEEFMDNMDGDSNNNAGSNMMPYGGNPYAAMPNGYPQMQMPAMPYGQQQAPVMPAPVAPAPQAVAPQVTAPAVTQ
jgi:hypothetical protein